MAIRRTGHRFSEVPRADIPRSQFDRSAGHKTTFDAGYLIPILVDEVVPGDTFNVSMTGFARLATPLKPIMDNIYLDTFFFFVPTRLVWNNFQRFMGEQDDPEDSTDYLTPITLIDPANTGTIWDYMGLPLGDHVQDVMEVCSLPFRAYNLIWNTWFRDENLQDSVNVPKGDGPDATSNYQLLRRGKRHDYFTSALPWPQKGDSVTLPMTGTADVIPYENNPEPRFVGLAAGGPGSLYSTSDRAVHVGGTGWSQGEGLEWEFSGLVADLEDSATVTINELRQAFQVQKLLERDARGGTRYVEIIKSHFGVTSPDARLQRPEYLGGGSTPIVISPVANTAGGDDPQGNLAAIGTASWSGHGFTKSFTEHGYIIGLMSARADLTYQNGLNRMYRRRHRYDFYWPALAHIGEQAVLQGEIYSTGNGPQDRIVFGYQERYAEYRYRPSQVTGLFRSNASGTLDMWHLAQEFDSPPTLSPEFIEENPPIDRVIAVPSEPHFIADMWFRMKCARPMPVYGVPGLIDHF